MKVILQPLLFGLLLSSGWMNLSYSPAPVQAVPDQMTMQIVTLTPPPGPAPSGRRRGGASY